MISTRPRNSKWLKETSPLIDRKVARREGTYLHSGTVSKATELSKQRSGSYRYGHIANYHIYRA